MVMLTFFTPASGNPSNDDSRYVTEVIHQVSRGKDFYYFTQSNIYGSTMFGFDSSSGSGSGDLFVGSAVVLQNGNVGFSPLEQYSGSLNGIGVDKFAANYVVAHGNNVGLTAALLAGDDVIRTETGTSTVSIVYAGAGSDFIFMAGSSVRAYGQEGDDTFYFNGVEPDDKYPYTAVMDFERSDKVQLDPTFFTSLSGRFTKANIHYGPQAGDTDDYILDVYSKDPGGEAGKKNLIYYDPDGVGPRSPSLIATIYSDSIKELKVSDFLISLDHPGQDNISADPLHLHASTGSLHTFPLHLAIA